MIACDVNVLVYAHNQDDPRHDEYRAWVDRAVNGTEPFGLSPLVASGLLRVLTHPKVFAAPVPIAAAVDAVAGLWTAPAVVPLAPGRRHWSMFASLCRAVGAKGNAVPDAYLAALALEHGCTWYSADRGFARYPGLRWRHPLDPPV